MSFNDLQFIFLFFPIFFLAYYLLPRKYQNSIIVAGSLVFYWIGTSSRPFMIALLVGEIIFTWIIGLALEKSHSKPLLAFSEILLFAILAVFKYAGLFGRSLAFPLAISFYTFQMAAYLADTRRGTVKAEKDLIDYSAGVLLFVRLLSGPITSWKTILPELKERTYTTKKITNGLRDFIIGLALKLLIADSLAGVWNQIQNIGVSSISVPMAWLGIFSYSLQLYFDFWGYSRMAMGLGQMLGFTIPVNFRYPYIAKTMSEFWRRWHITLGAWFKEYIYIPLGGSRCSRPRMIFNTLVVWLFTGLWHGSTLNFAVWGLFLFAVIILEKFTYGKYMEDSKIAGHIYMFFLIQLNWLIFAVTNLSDFGLYLSRMFGITRGILSPSVDFAIQFSKTWEFLILGLILCTPLPNRLYEKFRNCWWMDILLVLLFWLCVYRMSMGLNDPFMYFSF